MSESKDRQVNPSFTIIGSILTVIWCAVTGLDYRNILSVYNNSSLPIALVTIDAIFFGAVIVFVSIIISASFAKKGNYEPSKFLANRFLSLSGAVAILLIANISAYFVSGDLRTIAVFYQIWTLPAFMVSFYSLIRL